MQDFRNWLKLFVVCVHMDMGRIRFMIFLITVGSYEFF